MTNSIFIDNLIELFTEVVSNHSNLIILGDINIHFNKLEDIDAKVLCDILEPFNITQHIKFTTHSLGHTLDIIATENRQNRNVTTIPGPYTGGSHLSQIFWEHENLSDLSIIWLIQLL